MKATVEEINSVQRRLKVVVSSEAVNKAFDSAYQKLKKKAKIQGFRPGKAPIHVIKKLYGSSVSYEVGETLINDNLFAAINDQGVKPVASPFVEVKGSPSCDAEYEFSAVVDVMPSIEVKDQHKGLQVECKEYEADDSSLEKELTALTRRHAKTSALDDAETPAAESHLAVISHTASIDGQELKDMNVKSTPVALGRGEIFPELESAIVGMKKGETKEVDIKVPSDFSDKELASKIVHFSLSLDDLYQVDFPELNDDFAKDNNFDSLEELKTSLRKQLDETAKNMSKQELEGQLLSSLIERIPFEVPPAMVDQVIDSMIGELRFKDKKDQEKALKDETIRKRFRAEAKVKAQNTIILWEVIKNEKLEVNDDEIKEHVSKFAQEGDENVEQQVSNTISKFGEHIRENLLFEKAINFLADNAKVSKEAAVL